MRSDHARGSEEYDKEFREGAIPPAGVLEAIGAGVAGSAMATTFAGDLGAEGDTVLTNSTS